MRVGPGTSSNVVPTSSNIVPDEVGEASSNLVPYFPRRGRVDEVRAAAGNAEKTPVEISGIGTRFGCVKCDAETGPDALLCQACYEERRPPRCQACGSRLAAGKCGWC